MSMLSRLHHFVQSNPRRTLIGVVTAFVMASVVGGSLLHLYDTFWWWDDMLHAAAGAALTVGGFFLVASRQLRAFRPKLLVLFAFCFAMAGITIWEIFEFLSDLMLHTAMQQWDMPPQAIVMGASYQGVGLRDTMSDIIMGTIGAGTVAALLYAIINRRHVVDGDT